MKNLYEIHTAVWINRLSNEAQTPITLDNIPDAELDRIAEYNMDAVWLMGIWERSPAAVEIVRQDRVLMQEFTEILPDFRDDDLIGSAYAIKSYTVDKRFGNEADLATLRQRLATRGMKLILDFVPNHTAIDNSWTTDHADYYITAPPEEAAQNPEAYCTIGDTIIAKGKDPTLDPWPDVTQLNAFSPGYRQASREALQQIATMCDGVRCDMAMLLITNIFAATWPTVTPPTDEYWTEIIRATKSTSSDFIFIAECYWDTETRLLELGFDYCYDKVVYDQLLAENIYTAAQRVSDHREKADQMVYFLENHDEQRAAVTFANDKIEELIAFIDNLPGLHLWYDGQFEGARVKPSVHLGRTIVEQANEQLATFYANILK